MSIAANGMDMSFSSDTGMAECLVIACKDQGRRVLHVHNEHVSLPCDTVHKISLKPARWQIIMDNCDHIRGLDDGPYGGTSLVVGDEIEGEMLTSPIKEGVDNWGSVRLMDYDGCPDCLRVGFQSKLYGCQARSALGR